MLIESVFPEAVLDKGTLKDCLETSMIANGLSHAVIEAQLGLLPTPLADAKTFLDRITNLWRYEFGEPYEIDGELMFGTHMWLPVEHLRTALNAASIRIPEPKQTAYFVRLSDAKKHWETLSEMMPAARLNTAATSDFEVLGRGVSNRTIDWQINFAGRGIALDVKSRFADLLNLSLRKDEKGVMPEPDHDPSFLFRSLECKFRRSNPDAVLQGGWITTHIQQNLTLLEQAFFALDAEKIHFAIFGDWDSDIHILARRKKDREFLLDAFSATESTRFTYESTPQGNV